MCLCAVGVGEGIAGFSLSLARSATSLPFLSRGCLPLAPCAYPWLLSVKDGFLGRHARRAARLDGPTVGGQRGWCARFLRRPTGVRATPAGRSSSRRET